MHSGPFAGPACEVEVAGVAPFAIHDISNVRHIIVQGILGGQIQAKALRARLEGGDRLVQ